MKPFYLIFICLFFVISCKNATEQKVADFLENFPKLDIPVETKDGKLGDVSTLKEIEIDANGNV